MKDRDPWRALEGLVARERDAALVEVERLRAEVAALRAVVDAARALVASVPAARDHGRILAECRFCGSIGWHDSDRSLAVADIAHEDGCEYAAARAAFDALDGSGS